MNEKLHQHGLRKKFHEEKPNEIIKECVPIAEGKSSITLIEYSIDRHVHRKRKV